MTEQLTEDQILDKLNSQGEQILSGHKDIQLDSGEVNRIWELEPTKLNKNLRSVIIQQLRNNRVQFHQLKQKKKAKKLSVPVPEGGIELDNLELDL